MIRWVKHMVHTKTMENACSTLVGKPEGTGSAGRPAHRRNNDIWMYLTWGMRRKLGVRMWACFTWLRTMASDGH